MARVSTYLSFARTTEEAILFYKSVFGGEFGGVLIGTDAPGSMPFTLVQGTGPRQSKKSLHFRPAIACRVRAAS